MPDRPTSTLAPGSRERLNPNANPDWRKWPGDRPRESPRAVPESEGSNSADRRLRESIYARLSRYGGVAVGGVEVRVENGVVLLDGAVGTQEARRLAEEITDMTLGILDMRSRLRVKRP